MLVDGLERPLDGVSTVLRCNFVMDYQQISISSARLFYVHC